MKVINKLPKIIVSPFYGANLKAQCARGTMFLSAGSISGTALRFVKQMILARLLAPGEIGLMAIVLAISTALEAFTEVGIRQSIIQNKRGASSGYLNVSWWFQLMRTISLFVIAFWLAPWVSSFYEAPQLALLLRVAFLSMIFSGLVSPLYYVLEKELKFGRFLLISLGSTVVSTVATIGLAFIIRNVWALVIGFVVERAIWAFLSFIICPFRPHLSIERSCLTDLLTYARRMLGVPMLAMLAFQTDILVLGKTVTKEELGFYAFALMLAQVPSNLFAKIVSPVLLSAFAKKQDNELVLSSTVLRITKVVTFIGIPVLAFIAIYRSSIMSFVYGPRYAAAAVPFVVLCGYSLVSIAGAILASIYMAVGKPHLHRRFVLLRFIILIILIYPSIVIFGLSGAALVVFLANFVGLCMQVVWMQPIINLQFRQYASCWLPGLFVSPLIVAPFVILKLFDVGSLTIVVLVGGLWLLLLAFVTYRFYQPIQHGFRRKVKRVDYFHVGENGL